MRPGPLRIAATLVIAMALAACGGGGAEPAASPVAPATVPAAMTLTSPTVAQNGSLPAEYTCDGAGSTLALSWSNAPSGTREFALMMTTLPGDGTTKWNWVVYGIPATASGLATNSAGVGKTGVGSDGPTAAYQPPCSQGPGAKVYTFTIYALSAAPLLPAQPTQVTGSVLTNAIAAITLARGSLSVTYARP